MFQPGQMVAVNDPTHFWKIKQGVVMSADPQFSGYWEVATDFGRKYFHITEISPLEPPKPAKRKPKGPPRTILVPKTASILAGPDTVGPGSIELYD